MQRMIYKTNKNNNMRIMIKTPGKVKNKQNC